MIKTNTRRNGTAKPKATVSRESLTRAVEQTLKNSPALKQLVEAGVLKNREVLVPALGVPERVEAAAVAAVEVARAPLLDSWDAFVAEHTIALESLRQSYLNELQRIEAERTVTITVQRPDENDLVMEGVMHRDAPAIIQQIVIGNPLWLAGPTQSGKSKLAEQAAKALGIPFTFFSFGPTQTEAKLSGYQNAEGLFVPTELYYAVKNGWLFLGDEADTANATVLIWLNNGVSNGVWSFPRSLVTQLRQAGDDEEAAALERTIEEGGIIRSHPSFRIVLTANTWGSGSFEYVGRSHLDPSTLARFDRVMLPYDEALERNLTLAKYPGLGWWVDYVQLVRQATEAIPRCPLIVSPSSTLRGARNLAGGMHPDRVRLTSLLEGTDATILQKVDAEMRKLGTSLYVTLPPTHPLPTRPEQERLGLTPSESFGLSESESTERDDGDPWGEHA